MDYCKVGLDHWIAWCGPTLYTSLRICLKSHELCRRNELSFSFCVGQELFKL